MKAYCDTSFLVSLYVPDANSTRAATAVKRLSDLVISSLVELEFTNALNLRIFRKELSARDAGESFKMFQNDLLSGVYVSQPISPAVFERARQLSRRYSAALGTRSLDILHVAAALLHSCNRIYTFDNSQKQLAAAAGLKLL